MPVCVNCGKTINLVGTNCPFCHHPIELGSITSNKEMWKKENYDYDNANLKLKLLSLIFFPFGILYYLLNKETNPLKSKSALEGSFMGIILILCVTSIAMIITILV